MVTNVYDILERKFWSSQLNQLVSLWKNNSLLLAVWMQRHKKSGSEVLATEVMNACLQMMKTLCWQNDRQASAPPHCTLTL